MKERSVILSNSSYYQLKERNKKLLEQGIPTLIPFSSFPRFSKYIPGVVPGDQIIVTANSGFGKSRLVRHLAIKEPMAWSKRTGIPIKIFLNSLEENKSKVEMTLVSQYIYDKYGYTKDFYEMNNFTSSLKIDEKFEKHKDEGIIWVNQNILNCLEILDQPNPFAFYKKVRTFLQTIGDFTYKGKIVKDLSKGWDSYTYHKPYIVIIITDTIDAVQGYKNQGVPVERYDAIRRFSERYSKALLCNKCGVISWLVSQQKEDNQKVEMDYKGKTLIEKLKPSLATLLSVKAIQQHCTLAFGLFDPVKYNHFNYMDYKDLHKLKPSFRELILLKVRESRMPIPASIPMLSYLERDYFEEMPLPHETQLLKQYYI